MADGDQQGNYTEGDFSADGQYGDYNEGQFTDGQYQQEGEGNGQTNEAAQNGSDGKTNEDESNSLFSRKLFVGGISWDTDNKDLREYFSKFGVVVDVNIKTDPTTGKSRGFGFVTFNAKDAIEAVLKATPHTVKGKQIDPKPAKARPGIKKIFVGGLESDMPEADIKAYFEKFGPVENVELPFDKAKNQRRQFAFVTFEREDSVELVCREPKQKIGNKECDIKKATPKPDARGMRGGWGGGFGAAGGRGGRGGGRGGRGRGGGYQNQGWGNQGYGGGGYGGGGYGQGYGGGYGQGYGGGYGNYDYGSGYGGGYDYSGWNYGGNQGGYGSGYGQQQSNYNKTRRGGGGGAGGGGYHPYSR